MSENAEHPAYSLLCQSLDNWQNAVSFGCNLMRASFVMRGHEEGYRGWEDGGCHAPPCPVERISVGSGRGIDASATALIERYVAGTERRMPWE